MAPKPHLAPLLEDIEKFLVSTGMGRTYFGLAAANNPHLVDRLRTGCDVQTETVDRIMRFLDEAKEPFRE